MTGDTNTIKEHSKDISDLKEDRARQKIQLENINEKLDDMKDNLTAINNSLIKLTNTVLIDNGKPSIISRLNSLEKDRDNSITAGISRRWLIGVLITILMTMSSMIIVNLNRSSANQPVISSNK